MSNVLAYDGQFFRVDITEVTYPDNPEYAMYVSWCSDAFKELKDMQRQPVSRFIDGPLLPDYADARRRAFEWIKTDWDAKKSKRASQERDIVGVVYTVWLFKGETSSGFEFEQFADAKMFAKAAEKSLEITKVGITNNESPQNLTIWERSSE